MRRENANLFLPPIKSAVARGGGKMARLFDIARVIKFRATHQGWRIQMLRKLVLRQSAAVLALAALALGASNSGALAFSAKFSWCAGSPSFALSDVPAATAKLQFHMTDLNVPSFPHGGGTIAYSGQTTVPCGAFAAGFTPPSPPPGQVHTYEFTIKALGGNGAVLATATARRKFPE
jgi:Phosphatidylethanolamine-binding protein